MRSWSVLLLTSALVAPFLTSSCAKKVSEELPSATSSLPHKPRSSLSVEELQLVDSAIALAKEAGVATEGLPDIAVERDGDDWIVSFTRITPGHLGGPGFQITIDASRKKALKILHYQ